MEILNKEKEISLNSFNSMLQKSPTIVGVGYGSDFFPYQLLTEPYIEVENTDDGFLKIYNKVFVPANKVTEFNNFSIVLENALLGYTTKLVDSKKNMFSVMTSYKEDSSVQSYAISSVFEEPKITKSTFTLNKIKFTIYKVSETQITSLDFKDFTNTIYLITTTTKENKISDILKGNKLSKVETQHFLNLFTNKNSLPETINAIELNKNGVEFNMYDNNGFIVICKDDLYELGTNTNHVSFHKDLIKSSKILDNSLEITLKGNYNIVLYW